jgi:hypothetical protein
MKYLCPVCGFWDLPRPAQDNLICPCCGTQFGYHDFAISHANLRQAWLSNGALWHSRVYPAPDGWDAVSQLARAGLLAKLIADARPDQTTRTDVEVMPYPWTAEGEAEAA